MNYIDLIVWLTLAIAIYNGWRQGVIVQLCSMFAILCGIWLGIHYGATVGGWLHISKEYASIGGLLIVVVATVIAVAILSRVIKKLFHIAGLGVLDIVLGIVLSVCKFALILSVLFGAFDSLNKNLDMVSKSTLAQSKFYKPVIKISDSIFPALDWTQKQINSGIEKL